jgi:hypothetical protein
MLRGVEADMRAFAAVTLTPVYYLPGDLVNIGADSIIALDAGHVAKIRQHHVAFGEGVEEVLQLMVDVAELDRDLTSSETVWERPEDFNPAAVADYMSKLVAAQIPLPMVAEEVGWSPQRVSALRAELAALSSSRRCSSPRPRPSSPAPRTRLSRALGRRETSRVRPPRATSRVRRRVQPSGRRNGRDRPGAVLSGPQHTDAASAQHPGDDVSWARLVARAGR